MPGRERSEFLVVGGGIGGLATALALARDKHDVRVLEQTPEFGEIGAGLQVAPNAARVLDRLGVLNEVTVDAFFPRRLVLRDALTGDLITAVQTTDTFERRYGYRYFVTHRADLHRALLTACARSGEVDLVASKTVASMRTVAGGLRVRCVDDTEYLTDAVVGADGLHSGVRTMLVNDGTPADSGYVAYRGTVAMEELVLGGGLRDPDSMTIWAGPGLHLVQYPVRRGTLCNQVATFDTRRYTKEDADDPARRLKTAFHGTCPEVTQGVALVDSSRRWPMADRQPARGWSRGTITMVGDAAHPMLQYLAQGACQAIEDAAVLAASVAAHHGHVEAAFAHYEQVRFARTARIQTTARTWGELLHVDGIGATLRAALLAKRSDVDFDVTDWLWGYDPTERIDDLEYLP